MLAIVGLTKINSRERAGLVQMALTRLNILSDHSR